MKIVPMIPLQHGVSMRTQTALLSDGHGPGRCSIHCPYSDTMCWESIPSESPEIAALHRKGMLLGLPDGGRGCWHHNNSCVHFVLSNQSLWVDEWVWGGRGSLQQSEEFILSRMLGETRLRHQVSVVLRGFPVLITGRGPGLLCPKPDSRYAPHTHALRKIACAWKSHHVTYYFVYSLKLIKRNFLKKSSRLSKSKPQRPFLFPMLSMKTEKKKRLQPKIPCQNKPSLFL